MMKKIKDWLDIHDWIYFAAGIIGAIVVGIVLTIWGGPVETPRQQCEKAGGTYIDLRSSFMPGGCMYLRSK